MTFAAGTLLTTCHLRREGLTDLLRLVRSVEAALASGELASLRHVVLLQGCSPAERREIEAQLPEWLELVSTEASLSSSAARNLLIRHIVENGDLQAGSFVGFPDDDAWYPTGALGCVARHFGISDVQLLLCRYGPAPSASECDEGFPATLQQALSRGACAAIFVRASLLAELGGFHDLLGLGTELSGGEDTDFVHRAFQRARGRAMCIPGYLVGHAAADPSKRARYYEGALAAILAHSRTSPAARLALIRKLAVGLWLVFRSRMSLCQYVRALRNARRHAPAVRIRGLGNAAHHSKI